MKNRILSKIGSIGFIQNAINEEADLSVFKEKPSRRVYIGIILIIISYIIGWPAVGFFLLLSVYFKEPLIVGIGGPAIYGFSHIVLWFGTYLAGARYAKALMMWALRKLFEKETQ